jgi:alpha-tubulin suppressor-like RCC1 family protein
MGVGGQSWPPEPVEVLDFGEVSGISANGFSTSAIGPAGSVWCWGSNEWGQVGSEDCRNTDEPHLVEGLTAITIATGEEFTAAIRADGSLWVWGCLTATSQFYPCFEPLPRPFH